VTGIGPATGIGPVTQIGTVSVTGAVGRAIRSRSVVLLSACGQQAVSDLISALSSLRDLGLRGDCLVWINDCEQADVGRLPDLLALGPATGSAVLLSATSPACAADLAAQAGLVVAAGPIADNLAQRLADLAVGDRGIGQAIGHELPIDALRGASIGNSRPSQPEPVAESVTAKLAFTDILRCQHRNSATMIAGSGIPGPASFRIVPVEVTVPVEATVAR
jgi:hypothetical protein